MTLIAGFKAYGTPFLIGDFLITNDGKEAGLRKKIIRISNNFVLGWTGHLMAADLIIKVLQDSLQNNNPDFTTVEEVLLNFDIAELGKQSCHLICWVIDQKEQHCFRWNSQYPDTIFPGCPLYDGSGDRLIEAMAGDKGLFDKNNPSHESLLRAKSSVIEILSKLYESELNSEPNRKYGFGFGYEALFLSENNKFEYLDNILYLGMDFYFDNGEKFVKSIFCDSLAKYIALQNFSYICKFSIKNDRQDRSIITPLGHSSKTTAVNLLQNIMVDKNFPLKAEYYCIVAVFHSPDFESFPITYIIDRDDQPPIQIKIQDNTLHYGQNTEYIERIFKIVKQDIIKRRK